MPRPPALQQFLDRLHAALAPRVREGTAEQTVVTALFHALARPSPTVTADSKAPRPAPQLLADALAPARGSGGDIAALADAFAQLEPMLDWPWIQRAPESGEALDLHAVIVGPRGLEPREDVEIGVSLLAPHRSYVDHQHPPDEVYLVLSPGEWRQGAEPWFEPGVGGAVYNQPHILHNMRAGAVPLLAFWCLPGISR